MSKARDIFQDEPFLHVSWMQRSNENGLLCLVIRPRIESEVSFDGSSVGGTPVELYKFYSARANVES